MELSAKVRINMIPLRHVLTFALGVGASAIALTTRCTDHNVTVHVDRTTEKNLRSTPQSIEVLYALASKEILVTNSYNLSVKLCVPPNSGSNPLQLLVHGATFNKNMWDSQYLPEKHNWVQRMHREGYPTLAVDLIGIHRHLKQRNWGLTSIFCSRQRK